MQNFIAAIKKYSVAIADVVFIIGAVVTAVNSFIRAVDDHYPSEKENNEKKS